MKIRDSGMPQQAIWDGFFEPDAILGALGLTTACGDVVEFGCGYGTFTLPAARLAGGTVFALDLDPEMIATTQRRAAEEGLANVVVDQRDFLATEAHRVLRPGGLLGIAHWNHDPATPRGPDMSFRPRPEQCLAWAEAVGFTGAGAGIIDLPPYHWGAVLTRTRSPISRR
jgi:SAM-dependent methyltransferase